MTDEHTLREVVEALAPLERRAGSQGEHEAAQWIARRLQRAGCEVQIDEERFLDGYARQFVSLGLVGIAAGALALTGRGRGLAGAIAAAGGAALVDDVSNGARVWRRVAAEKRMTWNVVAQVGDPNADRTLVVLAHHDAPQTGLVFDQSFQTWLSERFPTIISRVDTSLPLWWPAAAAPVLVTIGAVSGNRRVAAAGIAACALGTALALDIARSPVSPGANDNLSGVAALVELAERLRDQPIAGLRLLLASCGAEEVLQGGIYGFAARHFPRLKLDNTWVINLDSVGSPELFLLEGEGCFVMEDYPVRSFRDLIEHASVQLGRPLRRGCRSRSSTDAVIPARAGYPTATLCSWDPHTKCISNYHLMTDTPENLDYGTVRRAVDVTDAVARELASTDKSASGI